MKEIIIENCPYCGGDNFGEGYQLAQGCMVTSAWGLKGSRVTHLICKSCGSIVHSEVEKPEIFKRIKSR